MKFFVLLQLLFVQISGYRAVRDLATSSESCKPRPVLLDTRNTSISDSPRFIELHRCMGFDVGYAVNYRCVNTTSKHLNITLGSTQVRIVNHTQCAMRCACESGKYSTCGVLDKNVYCFPGMKWNSRSCHCELDRLYDERNVKREESVPLRVFVFSLIGELLVMVTVSYCFKRNHSNESEG